MVINMCEYNNVPKIRFKGFTDVWEQRKAKDLCSITTGKSNTQDQVQDGKYPFYIRSDVPVRSNRYLYDEEAVITIGDGNIGRVFHYVNGKFDLHQRCYKMADFKALTAKYFYYYFSTKFYERAMSMTAKATVDSVRLEMISDMEIKFPKSTTEQTNISELFTNLDNLITLHQRKCDTLVNVKKSLLEKMFPKNSSNIPEIRFNEFTDVWEQRKLQDITQIVMGQSPDSINYTGNSDDTVLIQGNADLNNGIVVPRIWSSQITKKSYPNDIIFTVRAPVGEIARNPYFATIGRGVASFKGNDFLYQSLIQKKENNYWNNISAGSTFDSINSDQLKNVIIDLPKNNLEQGKIGELFTNLDNLITLHQRKLEKLKNIKKSMLEKMFV